MCGGRVRALRKLFVKRFGRSPEKHRGDKLFEYLEPDPGKLSLMQKLNKLLFRKRSFVQNIVVRSEWRRFKRDWLRFQRSYARGRRKCAR